MYVMSQRQSGGSFAGSIEALLIELDDNLNIQSGTDAGGLWRCLPGLCLLAKTDICSPQKI